jgi:hypothetical protein
VAISRTELWLKRYLCVPIQHRQEARRIKFDANGLKGASVEVKSYFAKPARKNVEATGGPNEIPFVFVPIDAEPTFAVGN